MDHEITVRMDAHELSNHHNLDAKPLATDKSETTRSSAAQPIVIAATFTADLLQAPLLFWLQKLQMPFEIDFAPYSQVMQQLLSSDSNLCRNHSGFNVLLIRFQDWIRERAMDRVEDNVAHIAKSAAQLGAAIAASRTHTNAPLFIVFCPSSSALPEVYSRELRQAEERLAVQLANISGVHCWMHEQIMRLYPVDAHEDARTDRLAHIPYTESYFTAIATVLARRMAVLVKSKFKVIAIDCDNTLWEGVCGEDGAANVEITPAHRAFQELLVRQHDAGILLCLCSKNNAADVAAVFAAHPDMPLRQDHIISSRVNWEAKSANLASLANELDLARESFVLVDDSAMECAEVQEHHPEVLTLLFPRTAAEIQHFIDHAWVFDRVGVTDEARGRTAQYRQNRARQQALQQATDLNEFLASLELKITVSEPSREQLVRVAELVQRTTQFNLTGIKRRAAEIESLWSSAELRIRIVHVCDRFGDYGLVGALFLRREQNALDVETFVLSCRVLGRGVEQHILADLGRMALQEGADSVVIRYRPSARNAPARSFVEKCCGEFRVTSADGVAESVFRIPAERALMLAPSHMDTAEVANQGEPRESKVTKSLPAGEHWHQTAYQFSRVGDILRQIQRRAPSSESVDPDYVAPRTPDEAALAAIWAEVLGLSHVGVRADFFQIGGDSLRAVQVIARIGARLGIELSLYELFDTPTIEALAGKLTQTATSAVLLDRRLESGPAPLSRAQQRLWFIDQLEGSSSVYHIPLCLRLQGTMDGVRLQAAIDAVVARHETLRTSFVQVNGEPLQQIATDAHVVLRHVDLAEQAAETQEAELRRQLFEELIAPFNLQAAPLIRATLWRLSSSEHVLMITMHHLISDGWSTAVILRELTAFYEAQCEQQQNPLPPLSIQYADYAHWQQQWLTGPVLQKHIEYWKHHLHGIPELLELPTDRPRPAVQSYRGAGVPLQLGAELTEQLRSFGHGSGVTPAMVLYAAWAITLCRLSGEADVVIGVPVANRLRPEFEDLIGFFVNTLSVRVRLDDDPSILDLLQRVRDVMVGAYAHQDTPFELVVEAIHPARSLSHSPIFQVMFTLQPQARAQMRMAGISVTEVEVPPHAAKFDLTLSLQESSEGIGGYLNYASDLFEATTIERWAGHFRNVLIGMLREPRCRVSTLSLLRDEERQIAAMSRGPRMARPHELVHELFEQQVVRRPEAIAVTFGEQSLTYAQLNGRANRVARLLRSHGIGSDRLVGLYVERGVEMLVGMLGILKSGGAYVPLDPGNPLDRLGYILRDAKPLVLLTHTRLSGALPEIAAEIVALDGPEVERYGADNLNPPELPSNPRQLAYVIYTSGSTGRPKGVMVEHRNVVNYAMHVARQFELTAGNGSLVGTSMSFDLMLTGLYPVLFCGKTVHLCREEQGLPLLAQDLMRTSDLSVLKVTPSHLALLESPLREGLLAGRVRSLVLGGEQLRGSIVELWRTHAPSTRIFNHYGPTEATIGCVVNEVPDVMEGVAPIGRPISNTSAYILDPQRKPVPIGIPGELYIGGAGVARGYLNQPELTADRFVTDPFSNADDARMYRTGDLTRWRADGTIEYLGRNDFQVKIRGFRIELGEIEAQLMSHEQVGATVVLAREDVPGDKYLVAYVVPRTASVTSGSLSSEQLRAHLRGAVPEYMVPRAFVILERMPLTANGKVDRRALPAPEHEVAPDRPFEAPLSEREQVLADIWQGLLRVERVGRRDNFFELGGHSLLIVQMLERLRRLGLSADIRCVFEAPTLADLAGRLTMQGGTLEIPPNRIPMTGEPITPEMLPLIDLQPQQIETIARSVPGGYANIQDIYPLAPLQEGILFHHLMSDEHGDPYVVPTILSVSSRERLNELIEALQGVIERHDVLRTAVLWDQLPRPVQVVCRKVTLPVQEVKKGTDFSPERLIEEWLTPAQQRLDLRQAPLLRLEYARCDDKYLVRLQLHHLICDYASREIVISEVVNQLREKRTPDTLPTPYRNHVVQALAYADSDDSEAFFRSKLADVDESTAPFDVMDVHGDGSQVKEAATDLTPEVSQRLRRQARRFGVSAATFFHAAWGLVIAATSGRDDVVFGTVLLGRLRGSAGAQHILGMFINTLPLRLQLEALTAAQLLELTQRELADLLGHEQASLAVAQRCSGVSGAAPLFTALINYRHRPPAADAQWSGAGDIEVVATRSRTNYPIVLCVDDLGENFGLSAQTSCRVEPQRLVDYMRTAVISMVDALESAPQTPALALTIVPEAERRQVIETFNDTRIGFPRSSRVDELFEEQAARTPDAIAVLDGPISLSYAQLNARANQLARQLIENGVRPGDYVVVMMKRSLHMLISQIAVLKCAAVYVPLDPELPEERRAFVIRDCFARCMMVDGDTWQTALELPPIIDVPVAAARVGKYSSENLLLRVDPTPPAYVMYTSGSTGLPKGVVVAHAGIVRLAINNGYAAYRSDDCFAHHSNPAFDASNIEVWCALLNGARLVIVPQSVLLEPELFADLLRRSHVTILYMSMGLFGQYHQILADVFPSLRYLMVGGEALEPGAIQRVLRNNPPMHLLNVYGPTESTTLATSYLIESVADDATSIPIGKPLANTTTYILNKRGQPVPVGVVGEIFIGGDGIACGYLNRPQLTQERFVADPLGVDANGRLYKTGDLARWRTDGNIEFLGRNDHQVKMRGYRIELGEIEARISEHPGVREVVVLAREDVPGDKRLVAYVVLGEVPADVSGEVIRAHLRSRLPEYMVPSAFVMLESLPLNSSGKVNRRALPVPAGDAYSTVGYDAPEDELEQRLAVVWQEILGLERIGRNDNFFDIGGHSLLALKAVFSMNQSLSASLRVTDIYRNPSIRQLAQHISEGTTEDRPVQLAVEAALDETIVPAPGALSSRAEAILLTGATGFVGRFLLAQLLQDTDVTIYCLVRAASESLAAERLEETLKKWDLWREQFASRIVAVAGDLRRPRLGLNNSNHELLVNRVDTIYHCATSMNHLETYEMAKAANVESCRELLRIGGRGKPKVINYISSLGVFAPAAPGTTRIVDERTPIDREKHWNSRGYVASKWVGEKICMIARERGFACNIFRLGLVWADARGRYDELQREARVLKSCLISGYGIKDYRYEMVPTTVDYVARAIVFLADRHRQGGGVFHVASSGRPMWGVFERYNESADAPLELLSWYEWICEMRRRHHAGVSLPVVPLIEYAFSMDEQSFIEHQNRLGSSSTRFDCSATHLELERAGIVAPVLNDALFASCIEDMMRRDLELRDQFLQRNIRQVRAHRQSMGDGLHR